MCMCVFVHVWYTIQYSVLYLDKQDLELSYICTQTLPPFLLILGFPPSLGSCNWLSMGT